MKLSYLLWSVAALAQNTKAVFDPKLIAFLKNRLKNHVLGDVPSRKTVSGESLESVVKTVSSIKDILISNDKRIDHLEDEIETNNANTIQQKNADKGRFNDLENSLVDTGLALTNSIGSEGLRIDELIDLIMFNTDEIEVNYNGQVEQEVSIQNLNNHVADLTEQMAGLQSKFDDYVQNNEEHLNKIVSDFADFMTQSQPFYEKYSGAMTAQLSEIKGKINGLEERLASTEAEAEAEATYQSSATVLNQGFNGKSFSAVENYLGSGSVPESEPETLLENLLKSSELRELLQLEDLGDYYDYK